MKRYLFLILLIFTLLACEDGNVFRIRLNSFILRIKELPDKNIILRGSLVNGYDLPWDYEQIVSGTEVEIPLDSILTDAGEFYLEMITIEETTPDSLYSIPISALVGIENTIMGSNYVIDGLQTANEMFYFPDGDSISIPRNYQWKISFDPEDSPPIDWQSTEIISVIIKIPDSPDYFAERYWIVYHTGSAFKKSIFKSREINLWIPETSLYALQIFDQDWKKVKSIEVRTTLNTLILDKPRLIDGNYVFIFELDDGYLTKIN
jgi:hypothetical protein